MEELYQLAGADFDVVDENGMTPLMKATIKGDIELLSFVIKQTRDINLEDKEGNSALYYATKENNLDAVKLLHENGAIITDFVYMIAIHNNLKTITKFFDSYNRNIALD
jgi:ankyrin repeat protein